jgi:glycosyltransferase involved in cell wall biosynthesis
MPAELVVLFVTPRFHSNMAPFERAINLHGGVAHYLVERRGPSESVPRGQKILLPLDSRTPERLGRLLDELAPSLVVMRSFDLRTRQLWRISQTRGIPCVTYDQGPIRIGFSAGFTNPIKTSRFVASYFRRMVAVPEYRRISPVEKWGRGVSFSLPRSYYVAHPMEPGAISKANLASNSLSVIVVAKHGQKRKRVRWLLKLQRASEVRFELLLVGAAPEDADRARYHRGTMRAVRDSQNQGHSVSVLSNLSRTKLRALYGRADILVLPSKREPFAISPLEAMSFGLPVVVASDGGASSYVKNNSTGLIFRTRSFRSFKKACIRLLTDRQLARVLGNQARLSVRLEYSSSLFVDKIRALAASDWGHFEDSRG